MTYILAVLSYILNINNHLHNDECETIYNYIYR